MKVFGSHVEMPLGDLRREHPHKLSDPIVKERSRRRNLPRRFENQEHARTSVPLLPPGSQRTLNYTRETLPFAALVSPAAARPECLPCVFRGSGRSPSCGLGERGIDRKSTRLNSSH